MQNSVDLTTCKKGDILISSLGAILEYVGVTKQGQYLDHVVKYLFVPNDSLNKFPTKSYGTRTHDGFVFAKYRRPEIDHDIVSIIKHKDLIKLLK